MTTIAYRDGMLAADTMVTTNSILSGSVQKIMRIDGWLIGGAGFLACVQHFLRAVEADAALMQDPTLYKPPATSGGDETTRLIAISTRSVFTCDASLGLWDQVEGQEFEAWGSGADYALGAFAHGADPTKAVAAAIKLDPFSGGQINTIGFGLPRVGIISSP